MTASTWTFLAGVIFVVFALGMITMLLWSLDKGHARSRINTFVGVFFVMVALAATIDLVHIQARIEHLHDSLASDLECNDRVIQALRERFAPRAEVDFAGLQRDQAVEHLLDVIQDGGTLQSPGAPQAVAEVRNKLDASIKAYKNAQRVFAVPIPDCPVPLE